MKKVKEYKDYIFIVLSLIFIGSSIIYYGGRFIHYYKLEHPKEDEVVTNLNTLLTSKRVYDGDGLYEADSEYYFRGKNVNNYVSYSGRIFRIVSIDTLGNIKLVSDSVETVIYYGKDYLYLNKWLDNYLKTLNSDYLVETTYCDDTIDSNIVCSDKKTRDISLLSMYDYGRAGDTNSYLNNGSFYWLVSQDSEGNAWYINDEGNSSTATSKVSLGIRPVITIKADIDIINGDGSKDNPYLLDEVKAEKLNELPINSYISYSGYTWRVIENGTNTKVMKVEALDAMMYASKSNSFDLKDKKGVAYYLNNTFYNSLNNKDYIIQNAWSNGVYDEDYSLVNNSQVKAYVGLPSIGDITYNNESYFTMTPTGEKTQDVYVINNGKLTTANVTEEYAVYPVIVLNGSALIEAGYGTINDPYIIK